MISRKVFDQFPYGIVVVDRTGTVTRFNRAAEEMLGDITGVDGRNSLKCCDLLGCRRPGGVLEHGCLTELATEAGGRLPEIRIDLPGGRPAGTLWVTAASLQPDASWVVLQLRPGDPRDRRRRTEPHWIAGAHLHVFALGRTRVESREGPIGGNWLEHRAGQLLKYLVCKRGQVAHVEEIADAIWPGAGAQALNNVRHFVFVLREKLEPQRPRNGSRPRNVSSSFILAREGGYTINRDRVQIDADKFEEKVEAGLRAFVDGEAGVAAARLEQALSMYRGDFIADEPYAEWAFAERDRLREQGGRALRALGEIKLRAHDLDGADKYVQALAEMEPFDTDVQRQLITLCLKRGRRSQARRRYAALRMRMLREFGEEPDFDLSELTVGLRP